MAAEFRKAECESLRKEIGDTLGEIRALERYVLGAVGAIIAWLATHSKEIGLMTRLAWLLPLVIVMLGNIRLYALNKSMGIAATYISDREHGPKNIAPYPDKLNWEHYRYDESAHLKLSYWIVWSVLAAVTLGVGILGLCQQSR